MLIKVEIPSSWSGKGFIKPSKAISIMREMGPRNTY